MIDYEVVQGEVAQILQEEVGIPFVIGNSNEPRPTVPYGTVLHLLEEATGPDPIRYSENGDEANDLDVNSSAHKVVTLSIQTYKGTALTNCSKASSKLFNIVNVEKLRILGLGLVDRTQIRNLSQEVDSSIEERAGMDVRVNVLSIETSVETTIGSVEVTGNAETATEQIPINIEVNEP